MSQRVSSPFPRSLLVELASRNHSVRMLACSELGERLGGGETAAMDLLLERLLDSHPHVRMAAAEALTSGPAERVEGVLLSRLETLPGESGPGHRSAVIHALGLLDRPCEGPLCRTLVGELGHADTDVRFQAAAALNRLECSDPVYERALATLVADPDDEVAAVAATAAADFSLTQHLPIILRRWRSASGFARRHLALAAAHLGADEVVGTLRDAMRSGQESLAAVDGLVALGSRAALDALRWAGRSRRVHPVVRARAAVALLELADPGGDELVRRHLVSRRTELRCGTMEWLGRTRQRPFVPELVAVLRGRRHRDSAVAARSLGLMEAAEAIGPLRVAAVEDPRPDVREEAAMAVARLEREKNLDD